MQKNEKQIHTYGLFCFVYFLITGNIASALDSDIGIAIFFVLTICVIFFVVSVHFCHTITGKTVLSSLGWTIVGVVLGAIIIGVIEAYFYTHYMSFFGEFFTVGMGYSIINIGLFSLLGHKKSK